VRAPFLQELLLLLDEYWARHPQLQGIPIYQASGVARKALNVFATYVAMMNQDIQKAIQVGGSCCTPGSWRVSRHACTLALVQC
jgi:Cft2 family RNA processing exonuclease